MIKGSIQEEDITIVNIYTPNIGTPQYIRQTLTDIKVDSNIIIVLMPILPAKSLQSYLTLCDPTDRSLPGSSVHGILQARTLEWVAVSLSNLYYNH